MRVDDELLESIADLLGGLQVPLSLGALGTAREPYIYLRNRYNVNGWASKEEVLKKLKEEKW